MNDATAGARAGASLAAQLPACQTRRVRTPDGLTVAVQDWRTPATPKTRGLVFLHGYSQSHKAWLRQITGSLAREFPLVTYDMRGHGDSDKPLQPPEIYQESRRWADEVHALIEASGLDHPVLVAWSYSGRVALDYLAAYGSSALGGLIMASASSSLDRAHIGTAGAFLMGMADPDPARRREATIGLLKACVAYPLPPDELDYMLEYNELVPPEVRVHMRGRPAQYEALMRSLDLPTLVLHGDRDPVNLVAMAEYTAGCIRGSRLIMYPGAGHMPFWEMPERFNADVAAFVRSLPGLY